MFKKVNVITETSKLKHLGFRKVATMVKYRIFCSETLDYILMELRKVTICFSYCYHKIPIIN